MYLGYIFGSYILFMYCFIPSKVFRLVRNFEQWGVDFGEKSEKHAQKLYASIWKQEQFYSHLKENAGVSFPSYSLPRVVYSIDLHNNSSQTDSILTQHFRDMV